MSQDLNAVGTNAIADAPLDGTPPVVVLLPGLGQPVAAYSALAEDLASHGYAVVGINPTGSALVEFPDGHVVAPTALGGIDPALLSDIPGWYDAAARIADVWVADAAFVVETLAASPPAIGALDFDHVAYLGHSMGGAASFEACRQDARCAAAVDLDGTLWTDVRHTGLTTPSLVLRHDPAGECDGFCEAANADFATVEAAGNSQQFSVAGSQHMDFSDLRAAARARRHAAPGRSHRCRADDAHHAGPGAVVPRRARGRRARRGPRGGRRTLPGAGLTGGVRPTMKAFVRDRYGSPDVLELSEVATPTVKAGEVLVRLRAASLNQADLDYLYGRPMLTRMGTGFRRPRNRGLGLDAAGEVEAVGAGVTAFRPGDEVFGDLTQFGYGAFAEYACAAEQAWAHKPPSMSFEEAATVPQSGILALQNLRGRRRIEPGDRVLVNGASGNVGPFAVQIAKAFGAHVTGVCRTSKMDLVRELGADEVIDYTVDGLHPRWTAVRLDPGHRRQPLAPRVPTRPEAAGRLRPRRRSRRAGSSRRWCVGPLISLAGNRKMGLQMGWKPFKQQDVAILRELIEAGKIKPVIDRRYGLTQVPDALRYLESGEARGKIVITI